MIELITIKNIKDEYVRGLDCNSYPVFTNNIMEIMSFENEYSAEEFLKEYCFDYGTYEIVNLKLDIKIDETSLKSIECE